MNKQRRHTPDEDSVLVASWRSGELSSFEALVRKYQKRMLTIAYRITGDYDDACEAVEDAFVAAYREIDTVRGAVRLSTWLTGITVGQCRDRLAQSQAEGRIKPYPLDGPLSGEDHGPVQERSLAASSAQNTQERLIVYEKLQECIMMLPIESREVIVLRDVQDFSYDEMSAILKVPKGSVKSRLMQAREMVRNCLKRAVGDQ